MNRKLSMLMVTPYAPYPPHAGGRTRMLEQIKYFGKRMDLTVISFIFSASDYHFSSKISNFCKNSIVILRKKSSCVPESLLPESINEWFRQDMYDAIKGFNNCFEVAVFEHIFSAQYASALDGFHILNEHNIESSIIRQVADLHTQNQNNLFGSTNYKLDDIIICSVPESEYKKLQEYENQTWSLFPLRTTVSQYDKDEIDSRCSSGKTIIVPNGVNIQKNQPVKLSDTKNILFMGTLDYYPNIDALFFLMTEIMPLVWERDSNIKLWIAGRCPVSYVKELSNNERVKVVPNPDDMSSIVKNCLLSVVPLRLGGGTRLKILDSMALGLPTVSTSLGAKGLMVQNERDILIRNSALEFAEAIISLKKSLSLRKEIIKNARTLVEQQYDWKVIFATFEKHIRKSL